MTDTEHPFPDLLGGDLSLDFANSADWSAEDAVVTEWLTDYTMLIRWGEYSGALTAAEASALLPLAATDDAQAALHRAHGLRLALHRLFGAVAAGSAPDAADLVLLNTLLPQAQARQRLAVTDGGFGWHWDTPADDPDAVLWRVGRAAADLLVSSQRQWIRQCPGDDCGWLFIDTSRNHSRRWCDMRICGNVTKARRFYARSKGNRADT